MTYNYKDVMLAKTDTELYAIVTGSADDYQTAAFEAAKEEFAKRNFSPKQIKLIEKDLARQQRLDEAKTLDVHDSGQQILEKIFPGIINAVTPVTSPEDENDKRTWKIAKGIFKWASIGIIVLYVILELIFSN